MRVFCERVFFLPVGVRPSLGASRERQRPESCLVKILRSLTLPARPKRGPYGVPSLSENCLLLTLALLHCAVARLRLPPREPAMKARLGVALPLVLAALISAAPPAKRSPAPLGVRPLHVSSDRAVKYDYDIIYVRAPRHGDDKQIAWTEVFAPLRAEPGSDLMLLHPDGKEEVLVAAGEDTITDPFVSFDGQSVYYARIRNARGPGAAKPVSQSADIFKIHVRSRKTVRLTRRSSRQTRVSSQEGCGRRASTTSAPARCPVAGHVHQ